MNNLISSSNYFSDDWAGDVAIADDSLSTSMTNTSTNSVSDSIFLKIPIIGTIVRVAMEIFGCLGNSQAYTASKIFKGEGQENEEIKLWYETQIYEGYADQIEGEIGPSGSTILDASGCLAGNDEPSSLNLAIGEAGNWYITPIDAVEDYEEGLPEITSDEIEIEGQSKPIVASQSTVSTSDQMLAASNAIQWGLIAAAGYGVAPGVTVPIGILTSLASETASFCMLPKDASLFRQALSFPGVTKALLKFNPTISRIWQAFSLYNLMKNSGVKLAEAWNQLNQDPVKALKEGALHLFNLSSGVAFTADGAGLIQLKPESINEGPCDPRREKGCSGPLEPSDGPCNPRREKGCSGPVDNREIEFVTVFDNKGNPRRDALSLRAAEYHKKYAEYWGYPHKVVDKNLVVRDCINPFTETISDCSPYWNKIKYFKNWCEQPSKSGFEEWGIYADDDAIYTNFQIDPSIAIDQLRAGKNSSFIIASEGEYKSRYQPGAVNTGVIIVRKDPEGCGIIDEIWKNRNVINPKINENNKFEENKLICPTFGICKGQGSGDEQAALDHVIWSTAPQKFKKHATHLLARDETHPVRGKIALNTLNRGGCVKALQPDGGLTDPYNLLDHDLRTNPSQIWREGDWIGQTAGYPLYGKDLSNRWGGCRNDNGVLVEPVRLKKVEQMIQAAEKTLEPTYQGVTNIHDKIEEYRNSVNLLDSFKSLTCPARKKYPFRTVPVIRDITLGAVYDNDVDRQAISDITNENHSEYAARWKVKHAVVEGNLVADKCEYPKGQASFFDQIQMKIGEWLGMNPSRDDSSKLTDCAPYWNKVEMIRNWLKEPKKSDVDEEWRMYFDDDMLVMNQTIDPDRAIDQLREGMDTSVIIAKDTVDWQRWFFDEPMPNMSVNTGAFIVRKDQSSLDFFDALWGLRNDPAKSPNRDCLTIGMCKDQAKSMQEQEAWTMLLRQNPEIVGKIVSVVDQRDTHSATRANIAMNTFYRHGCFQKEATSDAFSYEEGDRAENPNGTFQTGDWLTQVAGVPVRGKDLTQRVMGRCIKDSSVPTTPIRLNRVRELVKQVVV